MAQDEPPIPSPVAHDFSPRYPHKDHLAFLDAIHERKYLRVAFYKQEDETIADREVEEIKCAPWDYGPIVLNDAVAWCYKFVQRDEQSWLQPFRQFHLFPSQIISMEKLDEDFEPTELIYKPGTSWCIYRDWHFPRRNS